MTRWFDRTFEFGSSAASLPALLERLGLAPARVRALLERAPLRIRTLRPAGRWSVQEHAGHLLDLEGLWLQRLGAFETPNPVLHPADLDNRRTHDAGHNSRDPHEIAAAFARERARLIDRAGRLHGPQLTRTALHPRLQRPMSAVDHCLFVAEHDDHHLASMQQILERFGTYPPYALDLLHAVERAVPGLLDLHDDATTRRPGPGRWSPREIVGHLIDSASNNHQRFVRAALREDMVFEGYAQDDWVRLQRYQESSWSELVALWAGYNRHLAGVMAAVPQADRERPRTRHNLDRLAFRPPAAGAPATLGGFMEDYVRHLEHHLAQILT